MSEYSYNKKIRVILLSGIIGAVLMASSDWLMIYGNTAFEGNLAWLTLGVADIDPKRNAVAMFLAFPAVIFYAFSLFGIRNFINDKKGRTVYTSLTAVGLTPWLCLHLLYTEILFAFGYMMNNGYEDAAYEVCEAVFGHFSWIVILADVIMLLPFLYYFLLTIKNRTIYPKVMAFNNPLIIFIALKLITGILPDVPMRLALLNGLMSEAMIIWFVLFMIFKPGRTTKEE